MDENVTYREKAKEGVANTLLEQTTALLKEILGPSWPQVNVEWDQVKDERGRALYALKLRDFTGDAEARFAPEELESPAHMRIRLYRLWGDLLQTRNRKQLQQLQQMEE